jgi:predicted alternative tryptophan synthase beta-subunit
MADPQQHKIILDESEMPTQWYNIVPDPPSAATDTSTWRRTTPTSATA